MFVVDGQQASLHSPPEWLPKGVGVLAQQHLGWCTCEYLDWKMTFLHWPFSTSSVISKHKLSGWLQIKKRRKWQLFLMAFTFFNPFSTIIYVGYDGTLNTCDLVKITLFVLFQLLWLPFFLLLRFCMKIHVCGAFASFRTTFLTTLLPCRAWTRAVKQPGKSG